MFTSSGPDMGQNKHIAPVSTIMTVLTHRNGVLSSYIDKNDKTQEAFGNTSLKQKLITNRTTADIKSETEGQLALVHVFRFVKHLIK